MAPFRLAHLSDLHLGPVPNPGWRNLANKRITGYLTYQGHRARRYDGRILSATLADLRAHAPDHVALTGDIVNLGLDEEFDRAVPFLHAIAGPEAMSIVPGNHDVYLPASLKPMLRAFGPWMSDDGAPAGGEPRFPFVRRRGPVALIGLSSGVATLPFIATGRLGRAQIARFRAALAALRDEGAFRVVMVHHPPYRGGTKPLRGLTDAEAFEAALRDEGAELVLHGHNHREQIHALPGRSGREVPVLGVAASSAASSAPAFRAAWTLIEVENGRATLRRRVAVATAPEIVFAGAPDLALAPVG